MYSLILYLEIDLFAIIILAVILNSRRQGHLPPDQSTFNYMAASLIAVIALDMGTVAFDGVDFRFARGLNILFSCLYWSFCIIPCYLAMLYCYYKIYLKMSEKFIRLTSIPIFINLALIIINAFTGIIFTVSPDNVYHRGRYFVMCAVIPFLYMFAVLVMAQMKMRKVPRYEKKKYRALSSILLIPLAGGLIQTTFYGIPAIWIGTTIAVVMCYIYVQNGDLSVDFLTGLNNRMRFDTYTKWKTDNIRGSNTMYIIMIDLNYFKKINDNFGHAEGDSALVRTAAILKRATLDRRAFLSRIGGDEFAIILEGAKEEQVRESVERIRKMIAVENEEADRGYEISLSIGYAGMTGDNKIDFDRLFSIADERMYQEKVKAHADARN